MKPWGMHPYQIWGQGFMGEGEYQQILAPLPCHPCTSSHTRAAVPTLMPPETATVYVRNKQLSFPVIITTRTYDRENPI